MTNISIRKILFTVVLLNTLSLSAQHKLEVHLNMFRPGDKIIKQQVEYKDPGRSGDNVLWNFSMLNSINDEYSLSYQESEEEDVITGIEHRTMYYYTLSGDSLLLSGYENPTTLVNNYRPETVLKFPVSYGEKKLDYYHGHGKYSDRIELDIVGTVETEVDAYGIMILPDKDTGWLHNYGDGLNVSTSKGSHSFIGINKQGDERAITSGHEV